MASITCSPRIPSRALAQACLTLIDQPARRQAMGAAGRRFAVANYNWQDTAGKMRVLYESMLLESGAPA